MPNKAIARTLPKNPPTAPPTYPAPHRRQISGITNATRLAKNIALCSLSRRHHDNHRRARKNAYVRIPERRRISYHIADYPNLALSGARQFWRNFLKVIHFGNRSTQYSQRPHIYCNFLLSALSVLEQKAPNGAPRRHLTSVIFT